MKSFKTPIQWEDIIQLMEVTEQFPGVSILEHGKDVYEKYLIISSNLVDLKNLNLDIKLPNFIQDYCYELNSFQLSSTLIVRPYLLYHDCGKPFVVRVDEEGNKSFPGHSLQSKNIFSIHYKNYPEPEKDIVATLIGDDMDLHVIKADRVDEYVRYHKEFNRIDQLCTRLVAAFAEIWSNAEKLNQLDTDTYKIKFKRLEARGKKICKLLFEN